MDASSGTTQTATETAAVRGNKPFRGRRILLWAAVLIPLFLAHLAADWFMASRHSVFFLHDDGDEYLTDVKSFAETNTMMAGKERHYEAPRTRDIPEVFRTPFMGVAGGLLAKPLGTTAGTAVFTALAATLLAWAVFLIARSWGGTTAGVISVLLVTFHPLFLTFSLRFSSECPFMLMLAAFILAWTALKPPWNAPVMGAFAGLACWVRPTALLLLPAFGVFLLVRLVFGKLFRDMPRLNWKQAAIRGASYAAAFLLVVAPMSIRNHINFGTWSPAGCFGGFNTFVGNNRDNALAYRAPDGKTFLEHQNRGWDRAIEFAKAMPTDLSPVEQDRRFQAAVREEIRLMGAGEFCHMTAAKAWHFIRPWPLCGAHSPKVFWLICVSELLLFAGGFAGIWLLREKRATLLLLLMILCVGWSAHTAVHLQMRHRVPFLDLPLILLSGVAFARLLLDAFSKFGTGKKRRTFSRKKTGNQVEKPMKNAIVK